LTPITARDERVELVPVGGLQLRVSVRPATAFAAPGSTGSGRLPLLLCNGIGAPIEMWSPFRDPLGRPTIAFDAPGVGESSVPLCPPTIAGVARLVLGVLDHLGVPTVDVLGVSWGGALAQEVAYRGGERVRRLVLCATMAGGAPVPGDPRVLAMAGRTAARVVTFGRGPQAEVRAADVRLDDQGRPGFTLVTPAEWNCNMTCSASLFTWNRPAEAFCTVI